MAVGMALMLSGAIGPDRQAPADGLSVISPAEPSETEKARAIVCSFPSNLFTRPDVSSATGLRVQMPAGAMPINRNGQRVSVAPYDRADGFSPGSAAIVHVPGLDNGAAFARTGAAGVLDIGQSLRRDQPIVMIDEASARRVAIFSELDANATSPQSTDLLIHPAATLADVRHAVLGVTGMDYGNYLLARSTDFSTFSEFLGLYYPDQSMYPVILDLLDQLWDRADPDGYAPYMTSHPLPDTPTHQVLVQIAYGRLPGEHVRRRRRERRLVRMHPDRARLAGADLGLPRAEWSRGRRVWRGCA
jgi:hypothetical protein